MPVKAVWAQNGCLLAENADYCKFVNEWVWLRSRVCVKWTWVQFWIQGLDRNENMVF